MIVLRRGRVSCRSLFIKHSSSLHRQVPAQGATLPPSADAAATKTTGRKIRSARRRPNISLTQPREWNRPISSGVLPVYDEALRIIQADSAALKSEADYCRNQLQQAVDSDPATLQQLRDKIYKLEVESEVNLPDVRWKFRNGMADFSKPVYRHLAEEKWRKEGDLDLLMERIHQMNVVPDVLPSLHPNFHLRINYPISPPENPFLRKHAKRPYKYVEPGVFLLPEQTHKLPKLYTTVFHPETRLYTLLMVDPDVPDTENQTFQTFLHWIHPNIPLSALSQSPIDFTNSHTSYIPPHPQKGTPYHRYVILLLPQESSTEPLSIPVIPDAERLGFNVRQFCAKYGLDGSKGGSCHMWREVWDENVSKIYADVLKTEEPVYGLPPKHDPYAEMSKDKYLN